MTDDISIPERIAEIDKMFEEATGWGSWMAEASAERRGLILRLRQSGFTIEDKWVLRTAYGRVSD